MPTDRITKAGSRWCFRPLSRCAGTHFAARYSEAQKVTNMTMERSRNAAHDRIVDKHIARQTQESQLNERLMTWSNHTNKIMSTRLYGTDVETKEEYNRLAYEVTLTRFHCSDLEKPIQTNTTITWTRIYKKPLHTFQYMYKQTEENTPSDWQGSNVQTSTQIHRQMQGHGLVLIIRLTCWNLSWKLREWNSKLARLPYSKLWQVHEESRHTYKWCRRGSSL